MIARSVNRCGNLGSDSTFHRNQGSAELPFALAAFVAEQVPAAAFLPHYLARSGDLEPFFRTLVSFLLRHFSPQCSMVSVSPGTIHPGPSERVSVKIQRFSGGQPGLYTTRLARSSPGSNYYTRRATTVPPSTFGSEHGHQAPPFEERLAFQFREVLHFFQHVLQDPLAFLDVLHFPATKLHGDLHFVVMFEESAYLVDFRFNIVLTGFWPQANFLELGLVLFGFGLFPRKLILVLAVIHDPANGRAFEGRHFHEIQTGFACPFQRLRGRHDAQ